MPMKRGVSFTLLLALASCACSARQTRDAGVFTFSAGSTVTCLGASFATGCGTETDENGEETFGCGPRPEPEVVEAGLAGMLAGSAAMLVGGILIAAGTPSPPKQKGSKLPPPPAPAAKSFLY